MFKYKYTSQFKNYIDCSSKKNFLCNLADYCLAFILSFILFVGVATPIYTHVDSVAELSNIISTNEDKLKEIIGQTYLRTYNPEDKTLSDVDADAKSYVETLVKTSYFVNEQKYPFVKVDGTYEFKYIEESATFLNKTVLNKYNGSNKPLIYFDYFKENNESLNFYVYDGIDYKNNREGYLYSKLFKYDQTKFESKNASLNLYEQLVFSEAETLTYYLVYNEAGIPTSLYNSYASKYKVALNSLTCEIEKKYDSYLTQINKYEDATARYSNIYFISLFLSFVVAMVILETIPPLFPKGHATIGFRMMRAAYISKEEFEPIILNYVLKSIARLFTFLSGTIFCLLFTDNLGFIFVSMGWFTYLYVYLCAIAVTLASLILILTGHPARSLPERIGQLKARDLDMLEQGESEEEMYGEVR